MHERDRRTPHGYGYTETVIARDCMAIRSDRRFIFALRDSRTLS